MQLAEERREKRKGEKAAWRANHDVERERIRAEIKALPLEEQIALLCGENAFMPGYYGIDFSAISDEELLSLPSELLEKLSSSFVTIKDQKWQAFRKRIKHMITKTADTVEMEAAHG